MEENQDHTPSYAPVKRPATQALAVAIEADAADPDDTGRITASGRGTLAEEILAIAFANGIKVREDGPLASILAALDLETPIPSEAIVAVAEILAKVYEANEGLSSSPARKKGAR